MVEVFANNGDPDQTPRSAASHLGLRCLPVFNGLRMRFRTSKTGLTPTTHTHIFFFFNLPFLCGSSLTVLFYLCVCGFICGICFVHMCSYYCLYIWFLRTAVICDCGIWNLHLYVIQILGIIYYVKELRCADI